MFGDGSIFYRKSKDRWVYQYYDAAGKAVTKSFRTEKEAKAYKKEMRNRKTAPVKITVGLWLDKYLTEYKQPELRTSSYIRLLQTAALLEPIADIPLDGLSPMDVQTLLNRLRARLASSTISKVYKLLNAAYVKACAIRLVSWNPMTAVDSPKVVIKKKEIFSFSEILSICRNCRKISRDRYKKSLKHDYETLFLLLLTTGMRVGELLALRWEDVDLSRREIHVHATVTHTGVNAPKTASGDRYIPLLYHSIIRRLSRLKTKDGAILFTGYIFGTRTGAPMSYQNMLKIWHQVCPDKSLHTFRHTAATYALAKGIPLLEVTRILGHAQASTTTDMYGHAMQNYNQKLLEQFSPQRKAK